MSYSYSAGIPYYSECSFGKIAGHPTSGSVDSVRTKHVTPLCYRSHNLFHAFSVYLEAIVFGDGFFFIIVYPFSRSADH